MNKTLLYALAIPLLSASGGLAAINVFGSKPMPAAVARSTMLLALLASGAALQAQLFQADGFHFGFVTALMGVAWLAGVVAFVEGFFNRVSLIEMLVFPFCAIAFALPVVLSDDARTPMAGEMMFQIHLLIALAAYSLLGLAAVHAVVMAYQERVLHQSLKSQADKRPFWNKLLDQLPSLLSMEATLFRQIGAGFALLSLTLLSGFWFAEQWTGTVIRFDHKTLFSVLAWACFAILLSGRLAFGWRGKVALRWCLGSYGVLVLAYFGTQFVLQFVLKRGL